MQIAQLRGRARYWQDRLNLKEWKIKVRWGKPEEMADCVGCTWWQAEENIGEISILRSDSTPEATLVHELLHIVLQGHIAYDGVYDVHVERAINKLTDAFLRKP